MADNLRVVIASPHERHDALDQMLRTKLGLEVLRVREQSELDPSKLNAFMPSYVFFLTGRGKFRRKFMKGSNV